MIEMKMKAAVSPYNEILLPCSKVGIQIDMIKLRVQKWIFTFMVNWFLIRIPRQLGFPGGTSGKEPVASAGDIRDWIALLGGEDPLEESMATHSSITAWRIPRIEEPGGLQPMGSGRVTHNWSDSVHTRTSARRPNSRKRRGSKEPPDEGKRRESKSWLKTQHSKNWDHGIWSHHFMANRWGKSGNSGIFYFLGFPNHCGWWLQPWN